MTPDVQAAADRVRAYLDARDKRLLDEQGRNPGRYDVVALRIDGSGPLHASDLRLLLAALDPADQPIDRIPTPAGLDYLRMRRQQHPKADADA